MRNIKVRNDSIHCIDSKLFSSSDVHIAGITYSQSYSDLLLLTNNGVLLCFNIATSSFRFSCALNTVSTNYQSDYGWFSIDYNHIISAAACISHSGNIFSVKYQANVENSYSTIIQEKFIEGGISTACWTPTHSCLVIITNVNTMLLLSDTFVPLKELTTSPRVALTPTCVSWRGDGEYFSVVTTDSADSISRVRLYSRNLDFVTMGRNVADGDLSVMKGLGGVTAYATNGSYVAVTQQRIKGKHQVIFLDGSGLMVDAFDIQTPMVPTGFEEWQVEHLGWDLNSALIAVCFHAVRPSEGGGGERGEASDATSQQGSCIDSDPVIVIKAEGGGAAEVPPLPLPARRRVPSYVHLYFRNTYYWYLKQQWEGDSLRFLGFDAQVVNRLYLSQVMAAVVAGGAEKVVTPAVRIVDIVWEITNSLSSSAICDATSQNLKLEQLELKRETALAASGLVVVGVGSGGSEAAAALRESEWELHLKRQRLGLEEKAQRCRDRNRIDARNTRNRKRQQMEELQLRIADLAEEKTRLYKALPEQNSDVASILMMLAGNSSSSAVDGSSSSSGVGDVEAAFSSSSLLGGSKRSFDSISAIVAAAGVDMDADDDEDEEGEGGSGEEGEGDRDILGSPQGNASSTDGSITGRDKPANAKQLAEERRKERNRVHAKKARARKKKMLSEMLATISSLEEDIRKVKLQKAAAAPAIPAAALENV